MSRIIYTPKNRDKIKRSLNYRLWTFLTLLSAALILSAAIYITRQTKWHIKQVNVSGLDKIREEDINNQVLRLLDGNYALVIPKKFIALVDEEKLSTDIKNEFPRIKEAKVVKELPDTINILIEERKLWGILCNDLEYLKLEPKENISLGTTTKEVVEIKTDVSQGPACAYVDQEGFTYEYAPKTYGSLIIRIRNDNKNFIVPEQGINIEQMKIMKLLQRELPLILDNYVTGFEYLSKIPNEIRVQTSGGYSLWFNTQDNFEQVFEIFKTVLEKEIGDKKGDLEYIDLRFGNKVFYKYKNAP